MEYHQSKVPEFQCAAKYIR